ncbi:alpha/beta hydrolase [Brucella pseudogrignonensis]|uniref:ABC-three component system protein n=1 Tax=Brucella pseudogrignonensis TaxID=419475 RepID=UPI0028B369E3|nr:ABC-three component system protein [Brucella pseudogrignonensis]MDT6942487.1 alpha/beta hydrolase [Brucella pseudogrignonensis]
MSADTNFFATIAANGGNTDVVFVHGLSGHAVETWTADPCNEPEGGYWPKWIAVDLPHLNLYTVGYAASVFAQWAKKENNLYDQAKHVLETLASYEFGSRPIIFICHSLGGLLVKQILRTALESSEEAWQTIGDRCIGVIFIATPHSGSSLANLLKTFTRGFTSSHVNKLREDNDDLVELNESFRAHCARKEMKVVVYFEKYLTKKALLVVDQRSADPGISGVMTLPVDADHINICKPTSRNSTFYSSIKYRLKTMAPPEPPTDPAALGRFEDDNLADPAANDRRDLLTKMIAAGREEQYGFANDSQSKFARPFLANGLKTPISTVYKRLLADVEQRFQQHVFYPLICNGAEERAITAAIQDHIIDPLSRDYASDNATAKTIMNALYFLTERCHIRWDRP